MEIEIGWKLFGIFLCFGLAALIWASSLCKQDGGGKDAKSKNQ